MRLALIGCGYVADFYRATLANHPELEVLAVMDIDASRADRFARYYTLRNVRTLEEVLADPRVDTVVNLTNPASHFEVSKAALEAGKHVYSEKPLATDFSDARELVELAERRGVQLAGAPGTALGEAPQTAWSGNLQLLRTRADAGGKAEVIWTSEQQRQAHGGNPSNVLSTDSWRHARQRDRSATPRSSVRGAADSAPSASPEPPATRDRPDERLVQIIRRPPQLGQKPRPLHEKAHQPLCAAAGAAEAREPTPPQERLELLLDEARQSSPSRSRAASTRNVSK